MPTKTAPVSMPRKGQVVMIEGVRHEVLRRYCSGMLFDLSNSEGLVTMQRSRFKEGMTAGRIVVLKAGQ